MNLLTYVQNVPELDHFTKLGMTEFIVSIKELSRFSNNGLDELIQMISFKNTHKLKLTLEWDALYQEKRFQIAKSHFESLPLHEFSSIRLQDPGTINFVKEKYPWLKIQLILETGNHNLTGLKRWRDFLGDQLERVILSNELSREHLEFYAKELNIPIEVLVFGRILLFYSPRGLLNPLVNKKDEYIEAMGTSEESPHSGFPLIENPHGTFMFNVKDLSLVEHMNEFVEMNINHLRLDFRFDDSIKQSQDILSKLLNPNQEIKIVGPRPFIKGFYNINKTDVLFTKLKNKRIQRSDKNYIGEVIDVEKDKQICVLIKNDLIEIKNKVIKLITPEGKVKMTTLSLVRNSTSNEIFNLTSETVVIFPFVRGVTVKTQVYLDSNT